jgi:hypothetical protein
MAKKKAQYYRCIVKCFIFGRKWNVGDKGWVLDPPKDKFEKAVPPQKGALEEREAEDEALKEREAKKIDKMAKAGQVASVQKPKEVYGADDDDEIEKEGAGPEDA